MFSKKIIVKDYVLKTVGIIINIKESITYVIPRNIPFEIAYKQITFYSHTDFVLYFKTDIHRDEFLDQIGLRS